MSATDEGSSSSTNSSSENSSKQRPPILYFNDFGTSSRSVFLTAKALKLELRLININSLENAYQNTEFLAINPQHTVPCLDDNGHVLADSHAICTYLVSRYGRTGDDDAENTAALLPADAFGRALVDCRLHFNNGTLYSRFYKLCAPVYRGQAAAAGGLDKGNFKVLTEALDILEKFLGPHDWLAGERMTVADLCVVATVAPIFKMLPVERIEYPRIGEWLERLQELPYYDEVMGQYLINVNEVFVGKLGEASQ